MCAWTCWSSDSFKHIARQRRAQGVTLTLRASEATIRGDEILLERLVSNLIQNAIKYNHAGGQVQVEVGPGKLVVANTGPVVAADAVPVLFEPSHRGTGERVDHRGGAGLGLAIVKSIVTAHGATATAEALAEGGLRVTVPDLPRGT